MLENQILKTFVFCSALYHRTVVVVFFCALCLFVFCVSFFVFLLCFVFKSCSLLCFSALYDRAVFSALNKNGRRNCIWGSVIAHHHPHHSFS